MSDHQDPFEEIKKQLQKAFGSQKVEFGIKSHEHGDEHQMVEKKNSDGEEEISEQEVLKKIEEFNLKPREIRDYLDRFVIKQDEAKKVLSVAICDHYNHVRECLKNKKLLEKDYSKQNIVLLGPTGVGKTYLMKTIAKMIGVPFVKADATKFSETGYAGNDVEDLVRDLVKSANGNTELAKYGIIYIDEVDKIAASSDQHGRDVSGRGVQINLLKLMEEGEVNLFTPSDMMSQVQAIMEMQRGEDDKQRKRSINTRHILFIVSGAFDKLSENIKKRVDQTTIGFQSKPALDESDLSPYLHQVTTEDLIKYGFEPEFIGRLPVRVACEALNKDDLSRILKSSEGSILEQYKQSFSGYNINMSMTDEAIYEIASKASKEKTGARGLMTVMEKLFRDFKFELPSSGIRSFEVDTKTVKNASKKLKQLLTDHQHLAENVLIEDIERFEKNFKAKHEIGIKFNKQAMQLLIALSFEKNKTINAICEEIFKDLHHGLKIVSRNSGKSEFLINKKMVQNLDKELSSLVVKSFNKAKAKEKTDQKAD